MTSIYYYYRISDDNTYIGHSMSSRPGPGLIFFALYNFSKKKNDLTEIFGKIHKITILDDKIFQLLAEVEKNVIFYRFI